MRHEMRRDMGLIKTSSNELHDAAVPDRKVFGMQYLYVGSFLNASSMCEEFYGAGCTQGILWRRRGLL
jgi:hypothetical protein